MQSHQLRSSGVLIDGVFSCHIGSNGKPGTQCVQIQGRKIPLYFDGYKTYFRLRKPSEANLGRYLIYEMTSPLPYEPQSCKSTRRMNIDMVSVGILFSRPRNRTDMSLSEW